MEITNKTLAMFLIAAIAVSLFGTIISLNNLQDLGLTGFATTANGTATVVVTSTTSIKFAVASVNWGTGSVNSTGGYVDCTLTTSDGNTAGACAGFNTVSQGFVLENDGNTLAAVTLVSNATAEQFIGDPTAAFMYRVLNNETGSCDSPAPSGYTAVNTTGLGTLICPVLNFTDSRDSMIIDINVTIPYTAAAGTKSARLTATAS